MYPQILHIAPIVLEFGRYNGVAVVIWNPAGDRSYRIEAVYDESKVKLVSDFTSLLVTSNDVGVAHFSIKPLTTSDIPIQFKIYGENSFAPHPVLASYTATFYAQVSELLVKSNDLEATAMLCQWRPDSFNDWMLVGESLSNLRSSDYTLVFRRPGEGHNLSCLIKSAPEVYVAPHGAQWRLTKTAYDSGWQNSGYLLEGLAPETYNITFAEVPGWTKPSDQAVIIPVEDPLVPPEPRTVKVANGVKTVLAQDFDLAHLGCLVVQYAQL